MATILQTTFKLVFVDEIVFRLRFHLHLFPSVHLAKFIGSEGHLVGVKPLPEPMMTEFIDTYMRHPVLRCYDMLLFFSV